MKTLSVLRRRKLEFLCRYQGCEPMLTGNFCKVYSK